MPLTIAPQTMLLALCVVVFAIVLVAWLASSRRESAASYRRKALLTAWERKALGTLSRQLRPGMYLCPQVRLAEMLAVDALDRGLYRSALNRVACKSVDFVVADIATGNPLLVIELDDKSHELEERRARDAFVNAALRQAGVPIVRFRPYQPLDIGPFLVPASVGSATRVR